MYFDCHMCSHRLKAWKSPSRTTSDKSFPLRSSQAHHKDLLTLLWYSTHTKFCQYKPFVFVMYTMESRGYEFPSSILLLHVEASCVQNTSHEQAITEARLHCLELPVSHWLVIKSGPFATVYASSRSRSTLRTNLLVCIIGLFPRLRWHWRRM